MASAKRVAIYNGTTWADYTPYIWTGSAFVKGHVNVWTGSAWVQIPNWEAVAAQPSTKYTVQPTGDVGITAGYVNGSYTIYCSSTNNANSYGAWKAFNGDYSATGTNADGWASASGQGTGAWLGIKMPYSLKNITVTIYNRRRDTGLIAGPTSGYIYGNDTNSATGQTTLYHYTSRNGTTSGYGNTYTCGNLDASFSFVRVTVDTFDKTGQTVGSEYCAIGEIIINGDRAV